MDPGPGTPEPSRPLLRGPLPPGRRVFANRTLNLRAVRAVGYDMDYTLLHYNVEAWERGAYEHMRRKLLDRGWPVEDLVFDPGLIVRGLVLDLWLGNVVKANRFGYVKRAFHGTRPLSFEEQHATYARTLVDLAEERWVFLNTLFSMSEACMYAQLVDRLDARRIPDVVGYPELYACVKRSLDEAHTEGALKAEIAAAPERFLEPDPDVPLTLLDQRESGKKVLLITNSEWEYTRAMLSYAFDPFLPGGRTWRDLFDLVFVAARKPDFFTARMPVFELATEEGLARPCRRGLRQGGIYFGGDARLVEEFLGLKGDEILYVGDHIFVDVHVSKEVLRWRTALVLRELEAEIAAVEAFGPEQEVLNRLMEEKETLEQEYSLLRLEQQRLRAGYGPASGVPPERLQEEMTALRERLVDLDTRIAPLAREAGELLNPRWGLLLRAGNDKSHLARQVERYADIYTSRVSNLLHVTPYGYLRSLPGTLPHDHGLPGPGRP